MLKDQQDNSSKGQAINPGQKVPAVAQLLGAILAQPATCEKRSKAWQSQTSIKRHSWAVHFCVKHLPVDSKMDWHKQYRASP